MGAATDRPGALSTSSRPTNVATATGAAISAVAGGDARPGTRRERTERLGQADERQRAEQRDLRPVLGSHRRDQQRRQHPDRDGVDDPRARSAGAVFGSVIMKKRKTRISGEVTSRPERIPEIGPRCQRAVIS